MLKRTIILLYLALIIAMGTATFLEKYHGTAFAYSRVYGSWWFCALWALLTATAIAWLIKRRVRNFCTVALHTSLVVILAGALTTHLTSAKGVIHLRESETVDCYLSQKASGHTSIEPLPFRARLDRFEVAYHEGTTTPADYISALTIYMGKDSMKTEVSMNSIFSAKGIRLYQSSYDDDGKGSYLSVNIDPWGIAITYVGYALLFLSLIWMLIDPKGSFRRLLRHPLLQKASVAIIMLSASTHIHAATALPEEQADEFGQLYVLYNGRICQMQTYALDFCKKLCGKRHYGDYTAEQVLTGFIFFGNEWCNEPIIRVKSKALRQWAGIGDHASVNDFFRRQDYLLGPLISEYMQGNGDALHKDAIEMDDKLQLVMDLRRSQPLKVFPFQPKGGALSWYAPADQLPESMEPERQKYIHDIFSVLYQHALVGHNSQVLEGIRKMRAYQVTYGAASIPPSYRSTAERIYNKVPFATILFMVNLTMAVVSLFFRRLSWVFMPLSTLALTTCIALRWVIGGTVPMSNGYETMLLIAWFIQCLALVMARKVPIMLTFGFLMSGFFLLVSHIGQMNPAITHIMPVLNSPLLSIHVSIIMLAYALLSITFVCGVTALLLPSKAAYLHVLSQLFLYPSLSALGIGIFTGAIWANVSWGTYWSWDPKEVWALITLMVYAVAVHSRSIPSLQRPRVFHLYMVVAFLTLLMTYFGVNYFLGGLHSYA